CARERQDDYDYYPPYYGLDSW
nr:immunoglobulin heavy chain junction region [Macaca mulatta]MOX14979.1 immunoglobulin heavy chain junction region [Macaca mulatta]MOX15002.1 immunoglobulin heavy chain junction region [Macaca mulatta]MOX15025.1 immunoglobulin heavy chain junction region [Macaca mulatta]MOX15135.1 immunoglobulin heavy chain junction region [Macaca mulatta]